MKEVEIEVDRVTLFLPDRHNELAEDTPQLISGALRLHVVIDTGEIIGWPKGKDWSLDVFLKVTDTGIYTLLDPFGEQVGEINQNYVPHGLIPGEYGDYVNLKIDDQGFITNWPKEPNVSEFFQSDFE